MLWQASALPSVCENESGTQFELQTDVGGRGYAFTEGSYKEITYSISEKDGLCLYDKEGEKLTINRGKTYIGILKSSMLENFKEYVS